MGGVHHQVRHSEQISIRTASGGFRAVREVEFPNTGGFRTLSRPASRRQSILQISRGVEDFPIVGWYLENSLPADNSPAILAQLGL
jgi:hypothetical protein